MRRALLALLFASLGWSGPVAGLAWGQESSAYRMEAVQSAPAEVAETIAKTLQSRGFRLVSGEGKTIAELWLRHALPLKANVSGSGYESLAEGTLVGVLNFPAGGSDFRGQPIPAGIYTLRYGRIPQDGNHLGAAPESNFLLLCPAAADQQLDASLDFNGVVELSRRASRTHHPAPLLLLRASDGGESAGIQRNELGHAALRVKTSAKPASTETTQDFSVALVLVGRAEL